MKYTRGYLGIWHNPSPTPCTTAADFDALFRAKYGKGYLEAELDMRWVMLPRVFRITSLMKDGDVSLIDVGTCYGTFLTCLPPAWRAYGIEPMKGIAGYAYNKLHRQVMAGTTRNIVPKSANVVTAWNVIEHVEDVTAFLYDIKKALEPGGLLCISTPNASGGFFRFRRAEYEAADDPSHVWAFSPRTLKKLLKSFGFKIERVVITGHHPERYGRAMWVSRLFKLGDTFETFARKL
jgi:SAM-dependent methyltransferase